MRYDVSEDQTLLVETTSRFLERESPLASVRALHEAGRSFDPAVWRRGAELGWTSMLVPEALGGGSVSGGPVEDLALVAQAIGHLVGPGPFAVANAVAAAIARSGSSGQQADTLSGIVSGETIATWAVAEVGDPFPAAPAVWATPAGDTWHLDGVKVQVPEAAVADVVLVTATTPDGVGQFLVRRDAPGVTVRPLESLDLVRHYADVELAAAAGSAVGVPGRVDDDVDHQRRVVIALQCAETVGIMERVFDMTVAYSLDRVAFGRPIGSYQALKHRFADMRTWVEAANASSDAAAAALDAGAADVDELIAVAAAYIADRSVALVQDCIQIHGGIGVTWEHDLHLYLRRATQNALLHGTSDDHRRHLSELLEATP
ncbi:MAG: acyl-CoA dehydrogenase family protein [Ilumatobacteraceae bacterium]